MATRQWNLLSSEILACTLSLAFTSRLYPVHGKELQREIQDTLQISLSNIALAKQREESPDSKKNILNVDSLQNRQHSKTNINIYSSSSYIVEVKIHHNLVERAASI